MMNRSWNNVCDSKNGIETKGTFCASLFREAAARSVLNNTDNKLRANPQHGCDRAVKHFASGFVDRDVTIIEDNFSMTGGRSL
jgi:hypothetical protein